MRYNDLQDKCKECEHMKPWSLDMGGNHGCMCKKHQLDYFHKRADECNEYSCENCKDMLTCATCEYNVFDSRNKRCAKCVDCSNHSTKEEFNDEGE